MTTENSLLITTTALTGEPSFVIACDDAAAAWLAVSFRNLSARTPFVIGIGPPIVSDGQCRMEVTALEDGNETAITRLAHDRFRLTLTAPAAARFAADVEAIAASDTPCHQYLETGQASPPSVIMITKHEYDLGTTRSMRSPHVCRTATPA